mmetsp:Transcript_24701/g.38985  ORF Transcript_24701/g.38985 Transcript_24701/m.38985 type:complete len:246 (-) Transcript_24701:134-871(-)
MYKLLHNRQLPILITPVHEHLLNRHHLIGLHINSPKNCSEGPIPNCPQHPEPVPSLRRRIDPPSSAAPIGTHHPTATRLGWFLVRRVQMCGMVVLLPADRPLILYPAAALPFGWLSSGITRTSTCVATTNGFIGSTKISRSTSTMGKYSAHSASTDAQRIYDRTALKPTTDCSVQGSSGVQVGFAERKFVNLPLPSLLVLNLHRMTLGSSSQALRHRLWHEARRHGNQHQAQHARHLKISPLMTS